MLLKNKKIYHFAQGGQNMSQRRCPDCGNILSEQDLSCSKCGCSHLDKNSEDKNGNVSEIKTTIEFTTASCIVPVIGIFLLILLYLLNITFLGFVFFIISIIVGAKLAVKWYCVSCGESLYFSRAKYCPSCKKTFTNR